VNREEIINLWDGQDMDLLISKLVFGHSVKEWNKQFFANNTLYSTKISCAWQVVEKMRTIWKWVEITHRPNGYVVNFTGNKIDSVYAYTAPLAICRAALLAVESQQPNH